MNQLASIQDENELIGLIYDAALKPELWYDVLSSIRDGMGVDECTIYFYDAQCRNRNYANSSSGDTEVIQSYLRDFIDTEVALVNENYKDIPAGLVIPGNDLRIDDNSYEQLFEEGYRELVKHMYVRAGLPIIHGKIVASAMGIKTIDYKTPVTAESIAFLQRLSPHIVQSMQIYNQITSLQASYTSIRAALEATKVGVFLISESQQVLFTNAEATRILEANSGLNIAKGGRLQHTNLQEHVKLQQAMDVQLQDCNHANPSTQTLAMSHQSAPLPIKLNLVPLHHNHAHKFAEAGASLAIFVKDPNRQLEIPAQYLRQAYNFTEAEIEIAQALLSDIHLEKISLVRECSLETTRGHIKKITKKTNTHSQAELMQLLTCLSAEL